MSFARTIEIKRIMRKLPAINFNTLKYVLEFLRELITYEETNLMTSYNIGVCVAPNILRPKMQTEVDFLKQGLYINIFMQMLEEFDMIFNDAPTEKFVKGSKFETDRVEEDDDIFMQMEKANEDNSTQSEEEYEKSKQVKLDVICQANDSEDQKWSRMALIRSSLTNIML